MCTDPLLETLGSTRAEVSLDVSVADFLLMLWACVAMAVWRRIVPAPAWLTAVPPLAMARTNAQKGRPWRGEMNRLVLTPAWHSARRLPGHAHSRAA